MPPPTGSVGLLDLPSELLSHIIEYVLPLEDVIQVEIADWNRGWQCRDRRITLYARYCWQHPDIKLPLRQVRFDVRSVNRQLIKEATAVIHRRSVEVILSSETAWNDLFESMVTAEEIECHRLNPILPWLDFSQLHELIIKVEPFDLVSFWPTMQTVGQLLIKDRLSHSLPRLHLVFAEMQRTRTPPGGHYIDIKRTKAKFGDYESAINLFENAARNAPACRLYLPCWMEKHRHCRRLLDLWEGTLGAEVVFTLPKLKANSVTRPNPAEIDYDA